MRILLAVLFFLSAMLSLTGQDTKKQEAKEYFFHQKYADALAVLSSARSMVRQDDEAKFLLAICHYQLNQLEPANLLFKELSRSNKSTYPECWLYLGKIHHAMHQFEKAATYYKDYLRRIKSNHPNRVMVWDAIQRCGNGIRLQYKNAGAVAENLGEGINSEHDEFAPILSPNFNSKLYFSSIRPGNFGGARNEQGLPDARLGKHRSDIYSANRTNNQWGDVKAMHYLLNSPQHEVLLDFSANGSVLYYFKGWSPDDGQIYVDTFKTIDNRQLSSDPFRGVINGRLGDNRPYFVNDTLVYFSSRRPGGYGGLDLYSASYSDGRWSAAKNLGSTINSAYDETTPFLARDGRTLYFSSNNTNYSLGGLDILKTVYNEQSKRWTIPENIGTPINSSADESGFRIARDGFTAYFSSARKDGFGQRDLYAAYFSNFLPEMELPIAYAPSSVPVQVPTTTYIKEEVADAPKEYDTPQVTKPNPVRTFRPSYFDALPQTMDADSKKQLDNIATYLKDYPSLQLIITAFHAGKKGVIGQQLFEGIQTATRATDYLIEKGVSPSSVFMRSAKCNEGAFNQGIISLNYSFFKAADFPTDIALPDLESGLASAVPAHPLNNNLIYKVQVFSLQGSSSSSLLSKHPNAMIEKKQNLAYYRYTLGAFDNHQEAESFRKRLIQEGQRSAFVVPYLYGLRADRMMARRHIIDFPDLRHYEK